MKQKNNLKDVFVWLVIAVLLAVMLWINYSFPVSSPVRVIIWLSWLAVSLVLAFFTSQGKSFLVFAKEAKIELQKVFWPTRQETIQTTSIVMVMVAVTGFALWALDSLMLWMIAKITHLG